MRNNILYGYQFIDTWERYYAIYREMAGNIPELSFSTLGRVVGVYRNDQIPPLDAICHHYSAAEICSLLGDLSAPLICEMRAGIGGLHTSVNGLETDNCADAADVPGGERI